MFTKELAAAAIPLSGYEYDLIQEATDQYKKDLTDVVKAAKMRRLFETLDDLKSPVAEVDNNVIMAEKIPATLLTKHNLIPVSRPALIGVDGETVSCRSEKVELEENHLEMGFQVANLPMIRKVLSLAEDEGWSYLYMVCRTAVGIDSYNYMIRGA